MLRPRKEEPSVTFYSKFVHYFSLLMTLIYVALGLFMIFADAEQYNLSISQNTKLVLGGTFILYGIVRFVRVLQSKSKTRNDNN